jgi:hypothetical protein
MTNIMPFLTFYDFINNGMARHSRSPILQYSSSAILQNSRGENDGKKDGEQCEEGKSRKGTIA